MRATWGWSTALAILVGCGKVAPQAVVDAGEPAEAAPPPPTCPNGQTSCGGLCVDVSTNRAHCGSCGVACSTDDVCGGGTCVACPNGTLACGQERCVDLRSSADHCGACGVACGAPDGAPRRCEEGRCVTRIATDVRDFTTGPGVGTSGWVFVTRTNGDLERLSLDGRQSTTLGKAKARDPFRAPPALVRDGWVYVAWGDGITARRGDGSMTRTLALPIPYGSALWELVDEDHAFVQMLPFGGLRALGFAAYSNLFIPEAYGPFAFDATSAYAIRTDEALVRIPFDGSGVVQLSQGVKPPRDMLVLAGKVHWTSANDACIHAVPVGGGADGCAYTMTGVARIATDGVELYADGAGLVQRLSGSVPTTLLSHDALPAYRLVANEDGLFVLLDGGELWRITPR